MGSPVRFLFETDFSAPPPEPDPIEDDQEEEIPMIELALHHAELEQARARAHALGFDEGQAGAVAAAQNRLAAEAGRVAEATERIMTLLDGEMGRIEREAVLLTETIASKLAGHLLARFPQERLLGLIGDCLAPLREVRHLAIRVNEADAEQLKAPIEDLALKKGFEGRLLILGEPDTKPGDCRIEWADGGILYEKAEVMRAVDEAILRYFADAPAAGEATAPGMQSEAAPAEGAPQPEPMQPCEPGPVDPVREDKPDE